MRYALRYAAGLVQQQQQRLGLAPQHHNKGVSAEGGEQRRKQQQQQQQQHCGSGLLRLGRLVQRVSTRVAASLAPPSSRTPSSCTCRLSGSAWDPLRPLGVHSLGLVGPRRRQFSTGSSSSRYSRLTASPRSSSSPRCSPKSSSTQQLLTHT